MKRLFGLILVLALCFLQTTDSSAQYWIKTYGRTSSDYPYSIQQTTDGGYVAAGSGRFLVVGMEIYGY